MKSTFYLIERNYKAALFVLFILLSCLLTANAQTTRISYDEPGEMYIDTIPKISSDGKFVVYAKSTYIGLNEKDDIILYDVLKKTSKIINKNAQNQQANSSCSYPCISGNGRFIVYCSSASNLVPGDTNNRSDLFLYDAQTSQTIKITKSYSGEETDNETRISSISYDGNLIAYSSDATNIVQDDTNKVKDIFLYNRLTGITERITVNSQGEQALLASDAPAISADGSTIAFESLANNLFPDDTNAKRDIIVYKRDQGAFICASMAFLDTQANENCYFPAISADGRYVTFASTASNFVIDDTNSFSDIFWRDTQLNETRLISTGIGGEPANERSLSCAMSSDGQIVCFRSWAGNLVAEDLNNKHDAFLHSVVTGQTVRVSISSTGAEGNEMVYAIAMTGDAGYVLFSSDASNMVSNDTNNARDLFLRDTSNDISISNVKVLSISPNTAVYNAPVDLTISGEGFKTGATVKLIKSGQPDIIGTSVLVASGGKKITASFNITNKPVGSWSVVVTNTNNDSGTGTNMFSIQSLIMLIDVNPQVAFHTSDVSVTIHGNGFQDGCVVKLKKAGYPDIIGTNIVVLSTGNTILAKLKTTGAMAGVWDLVVINPYNVQSTNTLPFEIKPGYIVNYVLPSSGASSSLITLRVYGHGFIDGSELQLAPVGSPRIIATSTSITNDCKVLTATLELQDQKKGPCDLILKLPDGYEQVFENMFNINDAEPDIRVQILGTQAWRFTNGPATFVLLCINNGNMDAIGNLVMTGIPTNTKMEVAAPEPPVINGIVTPWKSIIKTGLIDGKNVVVMPRVRVPADSAVTVVIKIEATENTSTTLGGYFIGN